MKKFQFSGFTLIELMVVISIILILSAMIIPSYRQRAEILSLDRSANKLAQDLRRAQEMATAVREFQGIIPPGGYGIYLKRGDNFYILFADCNNNQRYDLIGNFCNGFPEKVEDLFLERKVKITNLSPASPLTITFIPPAPAINIVPPSLTAEIQLATNGQTRTIKINRAGLIHIE